MYSIRYSIGFARWYSMGICMVYRGYCIKYGIRYSKGYSIKYARRYYTGFSRRYI